VWFDQVTPEEMRAAQVVSGAAMAGLLAARMFGHRARQVRIAIAVLYFAAVAACVVYYLL
jgi:hypothetical protein